MTNSINWFEIPVKNFNRAKAFYTTLLGADIQEMPHPSYKYGILPGDMQNGVTGGIVEGEGFEPSMTGAIIYLNGGDDLSVPLSKVEAAGGKILFTKNFNWWQRLYGSHCRHRRKQNCTSLNEIMQKTKGRQDNLPPFFCL